ncbi:hypothetical protein BJ170DRAFT_624358 [Xylariales sp. AK1849]|nr:hypothetical protein BJ170DRAFT_624358 [Xylariales sp. AK1849]
MASLCTNRAEGFGPTSKLTARFPTQCFFDTVLVPLPTVLYLISLPVLFLVARKSANGRSARRSHRASSGASTSAPYRPLPPSSSFLTRLGDHWRHYLITSLYYFFIVVITLMETIEIARLSLAKLGVGLLPLVYVGLAAAVVLQATDGARGRLGKHYWAATAGFWASGLVITGVKIAAVAEMGIFGSATQGVWSQHLARVGSMYPVADQFTDLVVLGVFYLFAVGGEVGMVFLRQRERKRRRAEEVDVLELRSEEVVSGTNRLKAT